jgi:Sulfatase-modifying factor enzyme 1
MRGSARALVLLAASATACSADASSFEPASDAGGDGHDAAGDAPPPDASGDADASDGGGGWIDGCPPEMARIDAFCVDRWEAYLVEIDTVGKETPHSPYYVIDPGVAVRAKSAEGVVPQGYISQLQADDACVNAGKRLCDADEFALACRGPDPNDFYPYGGQTHLADYCNEGKGSAMVQFFGTDPSLWTYDEFNDPILNEWDGGLALTGEFVDCVSPYGVHDCVGNLHEWGSDPPDAKGHGRFRGGFYGDAEYNGPGCLYVTSAHEPSYHDYSTGFRCCMDAVGP